VAGVNDVPQDHVPWFQGTRSQVIITLAIAAALTDRALSETFQWVFDGLKRDRHQVDQLAILALLQTLHDLGQRLDFIYTVRYGARSNTASCI